MIPRIKSVKPLENYLLQVVFDDGICGIYDVKDDINTIPQYKDLQDIKGMFQEIHLDESRTCVFWSDEIDLPSDTIYENLILAWDPDFTKLTPLEKASLEEVLRDTKTISHNEINWD